jgi:DNA-binding transcriptional ArsR family regulator
MTGNVVILEPGDERAQKIAKAMASQTANDILTLLATGTKSLTDITEQLNIPLTTAKYHAENLLDAGLIVVSDTRYSIKGREVKMYSLTDQLLIVAPKQTNIRALLLKYSSLFGIVIAGTLAIFALGPPLASQTMTGAAPVAANRDWSGAGMYATKAMADTNVVQEVSPDLALAFFCGGVLVIFILLCYEAYLWRKRQ